ncbi:hypothetical protein PAXINDRAFT_46466, partial [Paxillus involutus ATCC 200175]
LEGHENAVNHVCFYPDENKLVSGSEDRTLRIWDRNTGAVEVLNGHTGRVWEVDVSRDGKMIVSGSADRTVRVWNGESGEMMNIFSGHWGEVNSVEFSRDSNRVVSGSDDRSVRVWSLETGELAFEPVECRGRVFCVRYSPSGDRFASGANCVQIWDAQTGVSILSMRNSAVTSLAWIGDGTHFIGGRKSQVTIWNSHNGEPLRTWKAHNDCIALSLPLAGSHVVTPDEKKTALVFDVSTGKQVGALTHDTTILGIVYSPSGKFIATGCRDNKVYLWE